MRPSCCSERLTTAPPDSRIKATWSCVLTLSSQARWTTLPRIFAFLSAASCATFTCSHHACSDLLNDHKSSVHFPFPLESLISWGQAPDSGTRMRRSSRASWVCHLSPLHVIVDPGTEMAITLRINERRGLVLGSPLGNSLNLYASLCHL